MSRENAAVKTLYESGAKPGAGASEPSGNGNKAADDETIDAEFEVKE